MKTKVFITVGFVVIVALFQRQCCWAQSPPDTLWSITFGQPCTAGMGLEPAMIEMMNGNLAIANTQRNHWREDFCLTIIDPNGKILREKYFGILERSYCTSILQNPDGGFAIAGFHGPDILLIKIDAELNRLWARTYSDERGLLCNEIIRCKDGGYVLAGRTFSRESNQADFLLLKTDANGSRLWSRAYGGVHWDECIAVSHTADGGYLLAGTTSSYGAGHSDFWVIKTNSKGDSLWSKTYGGIDQDRCKSMVINPDGGFTLSGDSKIHVKDDFDILLVRADENGNLIWEKRIGTEYPDGCGSMALTTDNGFILVGSTSSPKDKIISDSDYYIVKTDCWGNLEWTRTYDTGEVLESCQAVVQTQDSGYAVLSNFGSGGYTQHRLFKLSPDKKQSSTPVKNGRWLKLKPDHGAVLSFILGYNEYRNNKIRMEKIEGSTFKFEKKPFRLDSIPECEVFYFDSIEAILYFNLPREFPKNPWEKRMTWPHDLRVISGILSVITVPKREPHYGDFDIEVMPTPPSFLGNYPFFPMPLSSFEGWAQKHQFKEPWKPKPADK